VDQSQVLSAVPPRQEAVDYPNSNISPGFGRKGTRTPSKSTFPTRRKWQPISQDRSASQQGTGSRPRGSESKILTGRS
jgi:hypothetical protein